MNFIDGITLLNIIVDSHIKTRVALSIILLLLGVVALLFIASTVVYFQEQEWLTCIYSAILLLITIIAIIVFSFELQQARTTTTKYQVLIGDAVLFNDMMENYDIISQDGDIWTIEVKE